MQIVAGKYRHRKLQTNPGETTRPITARVKVALFDLIQSEFQDRRVADIYSGTGTIGLEALSRGARSVVFIENDRRAFDLLQQNIATLKVEAETLRWRTDVTKCSFRPKNAEEFLPLEVIFFDPPYLHTSRMRQGTMLYRSLTRLAGEGVTSDNALLLLRCARDTEFEVPPIWVREEVLKYSSMVVYLFRKSVPL